MEWQRVEISALESGHGYRILASCVAEVWCYIAYGPEEKITQEDGRRFFRGIEYKERYAIGEQVPPAYSYRTMSTRHPLGVFRENCFGGTDAALVAAKEACVLDFEFQLEK